MSRPLKPIEPVAAAKLHEAGALMVDVRQAGEYAQGHIPGSRNVALSQLAQSELDVKPDQAVIFLCATGNRTSTYATQLAEKAGNATAYVMQEGLSAWSRAGLAVEHDASQVRSQSLFGRVFGR